MNKFIMIFFAILLSSQVHASTCDVTDVTIEGQSAILCHGMFDGNVNDVDDVNAVVDSGPYTQFDLLNASGGTFSFSTAYSNFIEIVIKQNTKWAVFEFSLGRIDPGTDGVWNGTWNTSGMEWDGNPSVVGCQGCGGLSHAALVSNGTDVPAPATLALLGIGLLGLGAVRKTVSRS